MEENTPWHCNCQTLAKGLLSKKYPNFCIAPKSFFAKPLQLTVYLRVKTTEVKMRLFFKKIQKQF